MTKQGNSRERQVYREVEVWWDEGECSAMKDYAKWNPGVFLDLIEMFMSEKYCKGNVKWAL